MGGGGAGELEVVMGNDVFLFLKGQNSTFGFFPQFKCPPRLQLSAT